MKNRVTLDSFLQVPVPIFNFKIIKYDFKCFHCSISLYDKHSTYIIHKIKYEHVFFPFLLVSLNILTTRHLGNVMHIIITYVMRDLSKCFFLMTHEKQSDIGQFFTGNLFLNL